MTGSVAVVLVAALLPVLAPARAADSAWFPDLAALTLTYAAFRGTADRAALLGVAIGVAVSPWRPEPLPWTAFVLGATGYVLGHVAAVVDRERWVPRAGAAAAAVLSIRAGSLVAAAVADTSPLGADGAARAGASVAVSAAVAALCAAPWFAALRSTRLLADVERSFRDV